MSNLRKDARWALAALGGLLFAILLLDQLQVALVARVRMRQTISETEVTLENLRAAERRRKELDSELVRIEGDLSILRWGLPEKLDVDGFGEKLHKWVADAGGKVVVNGSKTSGQGNLQIAELSVTLFGPPSKIREIVRRDWLPHHAWKETSSSENHVFGTITTWALPAASYSPPSRPSSAEAWLWPFTELARGERRRLSGLEAQIHVQRRLGADVARLERMRSELERIIEEANRLRGDAGQDQPAGQAAAGQGALP